MMTDIQPADRVGSVKEYYFSIKNRQLAKMRAEGKDIINLGIGSPDMPPSDEAIEVLCQTAHNENNHSYQPYIGIPELRKSFADWYEKWYGVNLDYRTEIQPLIGSKEGVLHVSLTFLNPGDQVLIPNPGYPTYSSVSKLVGAEIIYYDLLEDNKWWPDFEKLEKQDLSKVKLMWTNYPNMPTGAKASEDLFRKIVAFGKTHKIVICNDNPYSFILNEHPVSILSVKGAEDICIELNSLSKSHNMSGWRIAMLASNPKFVQWILKVKSNVDSGQFKPMMLAAAEALKAPKEWYDGINRVYRERRKIAEEMMHQLGCYFDSSQSGMFLWGKVPEKYRTAEDLTEKVLNEAYVCITPGFIFGSKGNKYIRISLCTKNDLMKEALKRIKEVVK